MVHQELNLFANLSVANLFITDVPRFRSPLGWIRSNSTEGRGNCSTPSSFPSTRQHPSSYSPRASGSWSKSPRHLRSGADSVFDEPTTSLARPDAERLFEIIAELRRSGISIICISHNLGDVLRLCDSIAVHRDPEVRAVGPKEQFTTDRMITLMIGRKLETTFPPASRGPRVRMRRKFLEASGVSRMALSRTSVSRSAAARCWGSRG